jgi:hypothetical protein
MFAAIKIRLLFAVLLTLAVIPFLKVDIDLTTTGTTIVLPEIFSTVDQYEEAHHIMDVLEVREVSNVWLEKAIGRLDGILTQFEVMSNMNPCFNDTDLLFLCRIIKQCADIMNSTFPAEHHFAMKWYDRALDMLITYKHRCKKVNLDDICNR